MLIKSLYGLLVQFNLVGELSSVISLIVISKSQHAIFDFLTTFDFLHVHGLVDSSSFSNTVYFDPEGDLGFTHASALVNDTYIESPPFSAGSPPAESNNVNSPDYTHLAAFAGRDAPEYVNTKEKETNNWFANEEYMATDSGIGEDTQSLLSRGAMGKNKLTESSHSSSDETDPLKNDQVAFKPAQLNHNGLSRPGHQPCSTSSESSTLSCSSPTALNNPGYILLNASSSNNSNKQLEKAKPGTSKGETSV